MGTTLNTNAHTQSPQAIEYESCYLFQLNLPNTQKDDLKVEIIDNELLISRKASNAEPGTNIDCSYVFPHSIESELAKATFRQGLLRIMVPKREFTKQQQLQIVDETPGLWNQIFHKQNWSRYLNGAPADQVHIVTESRCVDKSQTEP